MNVAVCVKQIPDTSLPSALDADDHTLVREGKLTMDDSDSYGVEMGLQLVEAAGGGEVCLISMAPNGETSGLRNALAIGAARAVLVSDSVLAGSDALGTAKVLAAVVRRLEPDLVLAATESTDGYTGTMPVQIAELLGWPSVSFAKHVGVRRRPPQGPAPDRGRLRRGRAVRCRPWSRVTAGVVEPRYPSFKGIMAAKSKPIEELTVAELGLDPAEVGLCRRPPAGRLGRGGRGPPSRRDRRRRGRGSPACDQLPRSSSRFSRGGRWTRSGFSPSSATACQRASSLSS